MTLRPPRFPYAPAPVRPSKFPEPTCPGNSITGLGVARKVELQFVIVIGVKIARKDLREARRFDEFHGSEYTLFAYSRQAVGESLK
jgi:hypothetical protein